MSFEGRDIDTYGGEEDGYRKRDTSRKRDGKRDKKEKGYTVFEEEDSEEESLVISDDIKSPSKAKKDKVKASFKFPVRKEKAKEKDEKKDKETKKEEKEKRREEKEGKKMKKEKKKPKHVHHDLPAVSVAIPSQYENPIFGVPLAVAVERNKSHDGIELPAIFRECVDYIEECGLTCEGIYRISGVKSKVQALKDSYNRHQPIYLYEHEPNIVASLLKQFLRDLPEPVLTTTLMPKFEDASIAKSNKKKVELFNKLIADLPSCNHLLLSWMIVHMSHVIDLAKENKMTLQNVSIVLSPTMKISHRVLNVLFSNSKELFSNIQLRKYVPPLRPAHSKWSLELPDNPSALEEELAKQESLLNQLHADLNSGLTDPVIEEQLWEVQRVVTQLKRKIKLAKKGGEGGEWRRPNLEFKRSSDASLPSLSAPEELHLQLRTAPEPGNDAIQTTTVAAVVEPPSYSAAKTLHVKEETTTIETSKTVKFADEMRATAKEMKTDMVKSVSKEEKKTDDNAPSQEEPCGDSAVIQSGEEKPAGTLAQAGEADGDKKDDVEKQAVKDSDQSADDTVDSNAKSLIVESSSVGHEERDTNPKKDEIETVVDKVEKEASPAAVVATAESPQVSKAPKDKADEDEKYEHVVEKHEKAGLSQKEGKKAEERAVEEKAVVEKAVVEKAVVEKSVEEKSVEEKSVEEKSVEEKSVEEKSVEEKAVVEKSVEEKAVAEGETTAEQGGETSATVSKASKDTNKAVTKQEVSTAVPGGGSTVPVAAAAEVKPVPPPFVSLTLLEPVKVEIPKTKKEGKENEEKTEIQRKSEKLRELEEEFLGEKHPEKKTTKEAEETEDISDTDDEEDDEVDMDQLLEEEYALVMEEEELRAIADELHQKIATETSEMDRLAQEIQELQYLRQDSDLEDLSSESNSSDESEDEEDLQDLLSQVIRDNEDLEMQSAEMCQKIHEERMICLSVKLQIRLLQQKQLETSYG